MTVHLESPALDEPGLIDRAVRRDEAAIRTIIRRHNRRLYRLARSILRDEGDAEDAMQEAYIRAFTHLGEFRGEAALETWLGRIVINEALGRLRRRRPTVELDALETNALAVAPAMLQFLPASAGRDPERATAQRQIQTLLERAIDRLPPDFRIVLMARVVEEMSVDETAKLLGLKPETVKTRLHRARRLLRQAVEKEAGPILQGAFPFEDPRCERVADHVVRSLGLAGGGGNL